MKANTLYVPRSFRTFNRLLKWSYGRYLRFAYNVSATGLEIFRSVKAPYILVPNHVTNLDPFIISTLIPDPVFWVTGDGNMRSTVMRYLLSRVGSIPKSKLIPDLETVGTIVKVVRKRRGVVGIFAEGQASWDGRTQPLFSSTAKLLKLLKVPVIVPVIKGAYLSQPRWSRGSRQGRIEVEFKLVFNGEELAALSVEEIREQLEKTVAHDEYAWSADSEHAWRGANRAERLELALFLCPDCGTLAQLKSRAHRFSCAACGRVARLDTRGRLSRLPGRAPFGPTTVSEWDRKQGASFRSWIESRLGQPVLFSDHKANLQKGSRFSPLRKVGTGRLELRPQGLAFLPGPEAEPILFPAAEIEGAGVLKDRTFEFYVGKSFYRIRFASARVSARKWQAAVEILAELAGRPPVEAAGRAFSPA